MQNMQTKTLSSLQDLSFRVFERNFERYDGKYFIPYFVKKMLRQKFNVMTQLKDIASEFQKDLVYNPCILKNTPVCLCPDYVRCFQLTSSYIKPIASIDHSGEWRVVLHIGVERPKSDENYEYDEYNENDENEEEDDFISPEFDEDLAGILASLELGRHN